MEILVDGKHPYLKFIEERPIDQILTGQKTGQKQGKYMIINGKSMLIKK